MPRTSLKPLMQVRMTQTPAEMMAKKQLFGRFMLNPCRFLILYADVAETKEKKSEVKVGVVVGKVVECGSGICLKKKK